MNNPFSAGCIYSSHATRTIAVAPNGKWIAFGGWDATIQICELADGGQNLTYHGHKEPVRAIEWSPDGAFIASASCGEIAADVQVWNAITGQVVSVFQCDEEKVVASACLAWSPNGLQVAFGGRRNMVHLLNVTTGEAALTYQGHTARVSAVAWSPDGAYVASGGLDGCVQVWNANDGTHLGSYHGHQGSVKAIAWSPDGRRIVSGGDDKTVQVWTVDTRELLCSYQYHNAPVTVVGWSRDGLQVRSGSWDGTIRELDAYTGSYIAAFMFPLQTAQIAMTMAWNLDVTTFAMGLEDRRVIVADMVEGRLWLCRAPAPQVELFGQASGK